jgi:Fe-S-cluster containining protein
VNLDRTPVPCNGCRACCQGGEAVVLFPERGDRIADYQTRTIPSAHGPLTILQQKPNGDCVYLGEQGCTIHERAPALCRRFDCRAYFLAQPRQARRAIERANRHKLAIFEAARERLDTLSEAERKAALAKRGLGEPSFTLDKRKQLRELLL